MILSSLTSTAPTTTNNHIQKIFRHTFHLIPTITMISTFIALGLAGLAAAAPSHTIARRQAPMYPPSSQSNGFRLVANVTDPTKDFTPSVNGFVLEGYHTGAGQGVGVLMAPSSTSSGSLFYENGTAYEVQYGQTTIITDQGGPPTPYGMTVQSVNETSAFKTGQHDVYINIGYGTKGVGLTSFPNPVATLSAGGASGWAVCNNTLLYGSAFQLEPTFATYTDADGNYDYQANVPDGCAPVAMLPQCAALNDLPAGSYSSHEYANTVQCYDDVKDIDWTVYSAN